MISKALPRERKAIVKKILNQLISALYSMEKNGISHWDIKPDNILVDLSRDSLFKDQLNNAQKDLSKFTSKTDFVVKLADFGASKSVNSISPLTAVGN